MSQDDIGRLRTLALRWRQDASTADHDEQGDLYLTIADGYQQLAESLARRLGNRGS